MADASQHLAGVEAVQRDVLRLLCLLEKQLTPIMADNATATITIHLGKDKQPIVEVSRRWPLKP